MVLRATSVWLGPSDSTSLWVFVASGAVWVVVATALQYYHPAAYAGTPLGDAATLSVLAMTQTVLLCVLALVDPAQASLAQAGRRRDAAVAGRAGDAGVAAAPRPTRRPYDEVLVVGWADGPAAGARAERAGQRRVLGCLAFRGEPSGPEVLAPASALKALLKTTPASEVFLAADVTQQLGRDARRSRGLREPRSSVRDSRRRFPLQRAAPIDRGDGYVHCLGTKSRPPSDGAQAALSMCRWPPWRSCCWLR